MIVHCHRSVRIRNANKRGIFQTRVYGSDSLQTRVPGFDYVSLVGGRYSTVSGHLSEADSLYLRGGEWMQCATGPRKDERNSRKARGERKGN